MFCLGADLDGKQASDIGMNESEERKEREEHVGCGVVIYNERQQHPISVVYPSLHPMRQVNEFDLRAF